jgi:hypothetical protein
MKALAMALVVLVGAAGHDPVIRKKASDQARARAAVLTRRDLPPSSPCVRPYLGRRTPSGTLVSAGSLRAGLGDSGFEARFRGNTPGGGTAYFHEIFLRQGRRSVCSWRRPSAHRSRPRSSGRLLRRSLRVSPGKAPGQR